MNRFEETFPITVNLERRLATIDENDDEWLQSKVDELKEAAVNFIGELEAGLVGSPQSPTLSEVADVLFDFLEFVAL